jgi:hypothetical protein
MTTGSVLEQVGAVDEATLLVALTRPEHTPIGLAISLALAAEMACRAGGPDAPHPVSGVPWCEVLLEAAEAIAAHPLGELELAQALAEPSDEQVLSGWMSVADALRDESA